MWNTSRTFKVCRGEATNRPFKLISSMYETAKIPEGFRKNIIVTLPKKVGADKCRSFRTFNLVPHVQKILTTVTYRIIDRKFEDVLPEHQFVFRENKIAQQYIK